MHFASVNPVMLMTIKLATKADMDDILRLEKEFFRDGTHKPEAREAYELIVGAGTVYLQGSNGRPTGMLALLPVSSIDKRFLALPAGSPIRRRHERGYFGGWEDRTLVAAYVTPAFSKGLHAKFTGLERAVGFVPEDDGKAMDYYLRCGCRIAGKVENIHAPGRFDYVLTYERTEPSRDIVYSP